MLKLLKNKNGDDDDEQEDHFEANKINNDFTPDEAMAIQLIGARKKKSKVDEDTESEAEDEELEHHDVSQEEDDEKRRSITYEMSKNKGLMPKRSKLQRNPRVKHRVKYEKAKIRRKGQVREVRTEVKKYAGEMSGINKRVKKGIKLA
jgi:U3 small nucleolar RNA-associated protein 3